MKIKVNTPTVKLQLRTNIFWSLVFYSWPKKLDWVFSISETMNDKLYNCFKKEKLLLKRDMIKNHLSQVKNSFYHFSKKKQIMLNKYFQLRFWSGGLFCKCPIAKRIEIGTGSTNSRIFYGSIIWDGLIVLGILIWGFECPCCFGLSWLTTWRRWFGLLSCLRFNSS